MKKYLIIFPLLIIANTLFSQSINIDMNLTRMAIKEPNLGIEVDLNKYFGLYFQGGYDCNFHKPGEIVSVPLSPSQWDYPILVYHGPIVRYGISFKYDYNSKKEHPKTLYFNIGMTNKKLSYKDIRTYDYQGDEEFDYRRDENANVMGIDFLLGKKSYLFKKRRFYLDWHLGIGHRWKTRDFVCYEGFMQGTYHQTQYYSVFIAGISIGYQIKFKADNTNNKP